MTTVDNNLIEALADLEHQQWAHWTKYMLSVNTPENHERWHRQIGTEYVDLTEKEKDSDREWARKVVEILEKHGYRQVQCHSCNILVSAKKPIRYTCDSCLAKVQNKMDITDINAIGRTEEKERLDKAIADATNKLFARKFPVSRLVLPKELIALKPEVRGIPVIEGRPARVEAPEIYQDGPFELLEGF